MVCIQDPLVQNIYNLYEKISALDHLSPSEDVNKLMTQLVETCIPPYPIDVPKLCPQIQAMRTNLIALCGHAETLMEKHYSTVIGSLPRPRHSFDLFPYYSNYLKLASYEFNLLRPHAPNPRRIAFLGSGPLPLSSIVLASDHFKSAVFDNFDMDASANAMAAKLVESDPDLSARMRFVTSNVMDVDRDVLRQYDVVCLAALVGMEMEEKLQVIEHLAANMAAGAILMVRSAHGARAFLYPVVEARHLRGFEVLSVYHPTDEVINSILVARRCRELPAPAIDRGQGLGNRMMSRCKCVKIDQTFKPMNLMEEFDV